MNYSGEYIDILENPPVKGRKTLTYTIWSQVGGDVLGHIQWFSRWRQYCFRTVADTWWSRGCLREVRDFINSLMEERKHARRSIRANDTG